MLFRSDENPELDDNAEDMSSPDREEEVSEIEDPIASLEELINTDLMDPSEEDKSDEKDELDITPELSEINESIKTTLSKYFE